MIPAVSNISNKDSGNFFLIAGPCVVESEPICFSIAEQVKEITSRLKIPYIFKASYRKANRTRSDSFTGIVDKERSTGNNNVMLTERGSMFGYQDLIVDYRGIDEMKKNNCPVVLDITHSLQQPNQSIGVTGGRPELIETIAKAGIAVGFDGIFIETHPDPKNAKSDGENMLKLELLEGLLEKLVRIRQAVL